MKVIAWASTGGPMKVKAGETAVVPLDITADINSDLDIAYLVLFGWDDMQEIHNEDDVITRVLTKALDQASLCRSMSDHVADLETVIATQADRIAELEAEAHEQS